MITREAMGGGVAREAALLRNLAGHFGQLLASMAGWGTARGRASRGLLVSLLLCALIGGCGPSVAGEPADGLLPHGTRPVIKIGLVAPFEGRYRSLGYEVLYAVKWAVGQRNESGGVGGYMVELAALNDGDDAASSALQARKLAIDPDVMGVVGPFPEATALAAAAVCGEVGLVAVTPAGCSPAHVERSDSAALAPRFLPTTKAVPFRSQGVHPRCLSCDILPDLPKTRTNKTRLLVRPRVRSETQESAVFTCHATTATV